MEKLPRLRGLLGGFCFTLLASVPLRAQTFPFVFEYDWVGSPGFSGKIWLDAPSSNSGSHTNVGPGSYYQTPNYGQRLVVPPEHCEPGPGCDMHMTSWNQQQIASMLLQPMGMCGDACFWISDREIYASVFQLLPQGWGYLTDHDTGTWRAVAATPITIAQHPANVTVEAHGTASFVVSGGDSPVWSYQWVFNGTNLAGATRSSLTLTNVTQANLGSYSVALSNNVGAVVSSNAVLSMPPHLDKPFAGLMAYWGKDAELGVEAWGTGPLSYQWFKDGVAVSGGTDAKLVIPAIQFTNAGLYSVGVGNDFGFATNASAQVVVNPAGVGFGLYPGVMVRGVVGYTYSIQASAGLSDTNTWTTLAAWTLSQPEQLWIDTFTDASAATNRQRFYRVVPGQ